MFTFVFNFIKKNAKALLRMEIVRAWIMDMIQQALDALVDKKETAEIEPKEFKPPTATV